MTLFPPLVPSSRRLTPGTRETEDVAGGDGNIDRVRSSAALVGQSFGFSFRALTPQQARLIQAHWLAVRGTIGRWQLSLPLWGGKIRGVPLTPTGYLWRYDGPPRTTAVGRGRFDVEISVSMVPPPTIASPADAAVVVPSATVRVETQVPVVVADAIIEVPTSTVEVLTSPPVVLIA